MENQLDLLNIMLSAGWVVKGVLLLLFAASFLSWAIVFEKFKTFKKVKTENQKFLKRFHESSRYSDLFESATMMPTCPMGQLFNRSYEEILKIQETGGGKLKDHLPAIERASSKAMIGVGAQLSSGLSTLASIASVSPFIGLLGTVWGIIESFKGLAQGGGTIEAVAPGIAEALVATAIGLGAAIPAVWFFNNLNAKLQNVMIELESFQKDLLNLVSRSE